MRSIITAFAMFSRLPMPRIRWEPESMRWTMAALPLVGLAVGAATWGWVWLASWLEAGPFVRGAGFAALPVLLSGGIHLDGFCDVADALASRAAPDKTRAILKDPHVGGFAAIMVSLYLLAFAALASDLATTAQAGASLALVFMLSRALTGVAIIGLRPAQHSSLGALFREAAPVRWNMVILGIWCLLCGIVLVWLWGMAGLAPVAAGLLVFAYAATSVARRLGGMSGDVAGWLLQMAELAMLAALIVVQRLAGGTA